MITLLDKIILIFCNRNPFTNVYGLARSILAIGTLTTFLLTDFNYLIPTTILNGIKINSIFEKYNFFIIFKNHRDLSYFITIIILLTVISGYFLKITSLFHFWVSFSFFRICPVVDGGDQITLILTFFIIPITLFDNRKNHWYKPRPNTKIYINIFINTIFLLISIQVSIIYLDAFIEKTKVKEWLDGSVVYYWFNHNVFGLTDTLKKNLYFIFKNKFIISSITWGTLLLELLLFAALFMNKTKRKILLYAGILFHFLIFIFLGLGSFFFAMFASLILYLYPNHNHIYFVNLKTILCYFKRNKN